MTETAFVYSNMIISACDINHFLASTDVFSDLRNYIRLEIYVLVADSHIALNEVNSTTCGACNAADVV